ncbi:hypothetical protein RHMOL_Rhmol04G0355100 [Rhododendron molle]|uniref:Uncharacterized protein n=1 Tax=Rhododendron molle TaxID=49168 RepID=A0ACC0P7Z8_RHOML|nr:hypothetical protein RHMOL_Rhmol04G0355100 [Rhododendron molle]
MTLSSSSSSSSSSSHPLLAVKRTSSLSTSLLRPLIPASSSADIPCFSLAAETAARPSLRPDHDPRRMEFPDRSDFELWRADGLDFEHWQVCLGGFTAGLPEHLLCVIFTELPRVIVVAPDSYMFPETQGLWRTLSYLNVPCIFTWHFYSVFAETGGEPFINGQALPFDTKYYLPFSHRIPSRGGRPRYKKSRNLEVPPNSTKGMQSEGNKVEQDEAES